MATQFDPEMDEFTRQQAFADVLRKQSMEQGGQMMGRMFVPKSGLQSFAEGAAGGYMGASANQGRLALDQQRQQQVADFLRSKPSATMERQTDILNSDQASQLIHGDVAPQPRMETVQ